MTYGVHGRVLHGHARPAALLPSAAMTSTNLRSNGATADVTPRCWGGWLLALAAAEADGGWVGSAAPTHLSGLLSGRHAKPVDLLGRTRDSAAGPLGGPGGAGRGTPILHY